MKTVKQHPLHRHGHRLPGIAHAIELLVAIIIFAGIQGMWSTIVRAAPDITPPTIPTNLAVTGQSASSIDLSWDASTDDVGVVGYHLFRNGTLITSPTTTSYSDTGLTPSTAYTYTVSAYDASGNASSQSAPLATSTLADTAAPSVPANLRQTANTTSTISIAWDASPDNVATTGYEIFRNGSLIKTQAGTSFTDTGLAVYTTYTYTITAHDASNNSSNLSSPLYGGTAPDVTPPSVPDNLSKQSSTVSSVTIAWTASSDDIGVTGYRVYRSGTLLGTTAGTSYTDTGLTVSSSYTYTVSAYDAAGNQSLQSAPYTTASSDDTTAPTIPSNVHTTQVLDTSIAIAWNAATDDVGVTGYKIYRDGSLVGTTSGITFTDTGLTPVTDYGYTVKAYDAANNTSAASSNLAVQSAYDTTVPSVPANLSVSGRTDTTISLTWDAATDNVAVTGYDVYRGATQIATTASTTYTDTGRAVDAPYSYTVRAHDGSGNNSAQSGALATRTLTDTIAPASPTNLATPSQTTTSVDLSWDAASDDVAVTGYKLYRAGVFVAAVSGTTYTDTALHYNRHYSYTVTAVDNAGNESPVSGALDAVTLPDTVAPSVSVTAPAQGQTTQLTFLLSATASDDLELNRVEFYVDGSLIIALGSAPYALNWNSYAVHNGTHTISAKAVDSSGNASSQSVTINVQNPPPPIVGDLNGDHKVNIYDLSILLSHYNKAGAGDFNNNGRVDIFDLSVLLARYGQDNSGYH